jgi:hypothetical protein
MFYLGDSNISALNGPILSRSSVVEKRNGGAEHKVVTWRQELNR